MDMAIPNNFSNMSGIGDSHLSSFSLFKFPNLRHGNRNDSLADNAVCIIGLASNAGSFRILHYLFWSPFAKSI